MENVIELSNISKVFKIPHFPTNNLKNFLINFTKSRKYTELKALNEISMKINKGEFIGIIGRNGSGKSTLLKVIAGILYPTSGNVIVKKEISSFLELGVGFNHELTAKDNIYLYSSILGMSKKETNNKLKDILDFSELEEFLDAPLKTFSSGMQVRLAFSVAIQSPAPILLVDEVLAVGDIIFNRKCYSVFENFKKQGKTIVFVSHDLATIAKFCDRVFYLKRGEEIIVGKPDEMIKIYTEECS